MKNTSQPERGFWPEQAQCAAVITVDFDGESVEQRDFPNQPLWGRNSLGRYGAQIGIYRILDLLARHELRATFFIPGWDAERYPEAMERIAAAGHEIAGHGYIHEDFSALSTGEQAEVLGRSEEVFQRVFGAKPAGWRAPAGLMSRATRGLLAQRGYRYDSSFCDDDLPYVVADEAGNRLVELPVHETTSDSRYYRLRRPPSAVLDGWRADLSAIYEVGGLFNLTLHPRGDFGSGRAARLAMVEALLESLRGYPRVWYATCGEVADWALNALGDRSLEPA